MQKISIAYLIETLGSGGAERQLTELALHLDPDRYAVCVFYYAKGDFFKERLSEAGIPVIHLARTSRYDLRPIQALADAFRRREIDIVHAFADIPNLYAVLARKLAGQGRVIASVRSASDQGRSTIRWLLKSWAHRNADLTIANNEAGLHRVARRARLHETDITLIRNGVDLDVFAPPSESQREDARRRFQLDSSDLVFLSIGRFYWLKNYEGYLKAVARLAPPAHWKFLWVGDPVDKNLLDRLQTDIDSLGLDGQVRIIPEALADVLALYHAADVFVLNSLSEGTPNVIVETMACGLPVVAATVGDIQTLVIDQETGWLIPSGDDRKLADALRHAADSTPDTRLKFGRAARAHLVSLGMDMASMIQSHDRAYRRVVSAR